MGFDSMLNRGVFVAGYVVSYYVFNKTSLWQVEANRNQLTCVNWSLFLGVKKHVIVN